LLPYKLNHQKQQSGETAAEELNKAAYQALARKIKTINGALLTLFSYLSNDHADRLGQYDPNKNYLVECKRYLGDQKLQVAQDVRCNSVFFKN